MSISAFFLSVAPVERAGDMTIKDLGRWESLERVQSYTRSVCLSGFAAQNGGMITISFVNA